MIPAFTLHPRLAADTVALGQWPLCRLLLMKDARFPWVILVPARPDLREIHDLPPHERAVLVEEIACVSAGMQRIFKAGKMNVAALGNQVPQLHVHVIARFPDDPAWPNPVWGATAPPNPPHELDAKGSPTGRVLDFYHALQPLLGG